MKRLSLGFKSCPFCHKTFRRERDKNGTLQDSNTFRRQLFCSRLCGRKYNSGPHHYLWKGGVAHYRNGYIVQSKTRKGIHRLVMEKYIGRPLRRSEIVHHKNGSKSDNAISNLEIVSSSQHATIHADEFRKLKLYQYANMVPRYTTTKGTLRRVTERDSWKRWEEKKSRRPQTATLSKRAKHARTVPKG